MQEKTLQLFLSAKHKNQPIRELIRTQKRCKQIDILINHEANSRRRPADYFCIGRTMLNKDVFVDSLSAS